MADEPSELDRGTLLGLLLSSRASLDVAIARLRAEGVEPSGVHVHSNPKGVSGFGDDPPTYFCGTCGEKYDPVLEAMANQ